MIDAQLKEILISAEDDNVSDLHFAANNKARIRKNGVLECLSDEVFSSETISNFILQTMTKEQKLAFKDEYEYDYAFNFGDICRFRANAFYNIAGSSWSLRKISNDVLDLQSLNLPEIIKDFAHLRQGLVLVTGATGSGKSTSLTGIINYINQSQKKHIITIEDPTEFIYDSQMSLINQRELYHSTSSFAAALRAALREDPDIILVGEMRDRETTQLVLEAAETGHLVFSTLHTNNAADTVNRIIDMFADTQKSLALSLLSSVLSAVISQRLVPRIDCEGRYPLYEILVATAAVKNMIRENNILQIQSMLQIGGKFGMQTMADSVVKAVKAGIIAPDLVKELQIN